MKKNFIRSCAFSFIFAAAIAAASSAYAASTWLQFFFPTLHYTDEVDPQRTLVAPFADKPAQPAQSGAAITVPKELPTNFIPLDSPHRNTQQIAQWVTSAVGQALAFDKNNYAATLQANLQNFDQSGGDQYTQFLTSDNIMSILQTNRYYVRSFVQDTPVLLNQGPIDGRYHGVFEAPVMISYMDRSAKGGYKNGAQPVNQLYTITVQIGRMSDGTPGKDVIIERWSAAPQAAKN